MKKTSFLKELENDLRKARSKNDTLKEVSILFEIGENQFNDGRLDDSLNRFEQVINLCTGKRSSTLEDYHLDGLRRSIDCLIELESLDEALSRADTYVKLARELKNEPHVQQALLNKARVSMYLAEKPEITEDERKTMQSVAERMFLGSENSLGEMKKLKLSASDLEIPRKKASLYQNMAQFFNNIGEREKAIEYMKRGIDVASKSKDLNDILILLYTEGQAIYEKDRSFITCIQYAQRCLNLIDKMKEKDEEKFNLLFTIARYHCCDNDLEKAYKYLKRALKPKKAERFDNFFQVQALAKKIKLSRNIEAQLENAELTDLTEINEKLGDIYAELKAFTLSNDKYKESLDILKNESFFSDKIYDLSLSICLNLCDCNLYNDACDQYLNIAACLETRFADVDDKDEKLCRIYRHLSRCYRNLSDDANSSFYCEKAKRTAETSGNADCICKCADLRSQIKTNSVNAEVSVDSDAPADEEFAEESAEVWNTELSSDSEPEDSAQLARNLMNRYKRNGKGETKLQEAVIKRNYALVKDLIAKKYSVNVEDHFGWTPLHEAVNFGHVEICELLLDAGAYIEKPMKRNGFTALMDAIQNENFQCAKLLLERGAYPYSVGKIGICAADFFEWVVSKRYSENNTTKELRELFEEIRTLIKNKERPKFVKKVVNFNEKVLDSFLVSGGNEQCPEVILEKDEENSDQEQPESEPIEVYKPAPVEEVKLDEPGFAMKMYEDALKQQSNRKALYRPKTANDYVKSDKIKQKRAERNKENFTKNPPREQSLEVNEDDDRSWAEEVREKFSKTSKNCENDSDSGIQSISTSKSSNYSNAAHKEVMDFAEKDLEKSESPKVKVGSKRPKKTSRVSRVVIDSSSDSEKETTPPPKRHSIDKSFSLQNSGKNKSHQISLSDDIRNDRTPVVPVQPTIDERGYLNDSFVVSDSGDSDNEIGGKCSTSKCGKQSDSDTDSNDEDDDGEDGPPSPVIGAKGNTAQPIKNQETDKPIGLQELKESLCPGQESLDNSTQLGLALSQQPLCSTMIDIFVPEVKNRPCNEIGNSTPVDLSPVVVDLARITIYFITSKASVGFTTKVSVSNEDEKVSDLIEKATEKFKLKFGTKPCLQVKYQGVSYFGFIKSKFRLCACDFVEMIFR